MAARTDYSPTSPSRSGITQPSPAMAPGVKECGAPGGWQVKGARGGSGGNFYPEAAEASTGKQRVSGGPDGVLGRGVDGVEGGRQRPFFFF